MASQKNVPSGYHSVTPYLVVSGVPNLIDFMKSAFGATERMRNLPVYAADADVTYQQAIRAGASSLREPADGLPPR